ncbi:MAG: DUF692 domain-containing protein [Polyangiaceae bacterium]
MNREELGRVVQQRSRAILGERRAAVDLLGASRVALEGLMSVPNLLRAGSRGSGRVGVGWRRELAADLLAQPGCVDFVEVVAESCFGDAMARGEAVAIAEVWPVVPHGVKLSLGSAGGIDDHRAHSLGQLARDVRAPCVTEHVALSRAGGKEIGHLTAIPFTRAMASVVARNSIAVRRRLPDVPLLLENIAWTLRWPEDEMSEGAFYEEVAARSGCGLLLDIANLYANALNAGVPPLQALAEFPVERVGMIHVAGGMLDGEFYVDTHAHAVPEAVFALLEMALQRAGNVPIMLERDAGFPAFSELHCELGRMRQLACREHGDGHASHARGTGRLVIPASASTEAEVCARQNELASALTVGTEMDGFDLAALARSRRVLERKRLADALALLPRLSRFPEATTALARARLPGWPRVQPETRVADALRIAQAAAADPTLSDAARIDGLLLRARFVARHADRPPTPRVGPFVARERLSRTTVWAIKGPGARARVRIVERLAQESPTASAHASSRSRNSGSELVQERPIAGTALPAQGMHP